MTTSSSNSAAASLPTVGAPLVKKGLAGIVAQKLLPNEMAVRRNIRPSFEAFIVNFEKKALKARATRALLIYIPFLVLLFFYVLGSRVFEQAWYMRDGIDEVILREPFFTLPQTTIWDTFYDVSSYSDWFNWASQPLLTVLFPIDNNRYAIPVGALRFRQFRVDTSSCSIVPAYDPSNNPYFDRKCYPEASASTLSSSKDFPGYQNCDQAPASTIWGQTGLFYPCGGYIVDVPFANTTYDNAVAVVEQLKSSHWLDKHTAGVVVELFFYNRNIDVFMSAKFFVEMHYSGAFIAQRLFRAFRLKLPYLDSAWDMIVAILQLCFFFYVIYYMIDWVARLVHAVRFSKNMLGFASFWNLYDLFFFLFFLGSFISRGIVYSRTYQSNFDINSNKYPDLDLIVENYVLNAQIDGLLAVLCFLRTFQFLSLNDRLNLLGRTLTEAMGDLLGFLVVLTFVFLGFASMAFVVYGPELPEFRTFARSLSACFFILLGDSDYASLQQVNRVLTPIFFFGFMLLVWCILFNVFLAIINDSYQKATEDSKSSPIGTQILKGLRKLTARVMACFKRRKGGSDEEAQKPVEATSTAFPKGPLSIVELAERLRLFFISEAVQSGNAKTNNAQNKGAASAKARAPVYRSELPLRLQYALSRDATKEQVDEILKRFDAWDVRWLDEHEDEQEAAAPSANPQGQAEELLRKLETKLAVLQDKLKSA